MGIIHDETGIHIFTQALMIDWGIRRCNVEGCGDRPTAIWTLPENESGRGAAGLCETHYQQGHDVPNIMFKLIFDASDGIEDTLTSSDKKGV